MRVALQRAKGCALPLNGCLLLVGLVAVTLPSGRAAVFQVAPSGSTSITGNIDGLPGPSMPGGNSPLRDAGQAKPKALKVDLMSAGTKADRDAPLYAAHCGSCHYNGSEDISSRRLGSEDKSAVYLSDPSDLIRLILYGIDMQRGDPLQVMPAFGSRLSDSEIARIAAYLRRTRTSDAPWAHVGKPVTAIRAHGSTARLERNSEHLHQG
jgi:mono/diheme cytochrome c family protein